MDIGRWLREFLGIFALTFVVTVAVTLLWSLLVDGAAQVDWATAFRFGIIFGIVVPIVGRRGHRARS